MADENPFSDPAVLRHQQTDYGYNQNPTRRSTVAGNNPPTASQGQYTLGGSNISSPQSVTLQVGPDPPPSYTPTQKPLNNEELLRQQEALEKKAAELDRKERDLNQRAQSGGVHPNNFPPLPAFLPVKPCFYQDFDVDIPDQFRQTVKYLYMTWLAMGAVLILNVFASIFFVTSDVSTNAGATLGFSILILFLHTPCSYVCWMRAVYNAFKSDSSFSFFLYFFMFFIHLCILGMFALGIPGWGTCGWIVMFELFSESHIFGGILALLVSIGLTGLTVVKAILLQRVHAFYRQSDASFDKAQNEFSTGVWSNRHVQTAAASAARNAATTAATSATAR